MSHDPAGAPAQSLSAGAQALGLTLEAATLDRLLAYAALLERWNRAHNLVSRQDLHRLFDRHLLDCLSLLPHLGDAALLDVGSGGGLPGLVLAIARPDLPCTLLDSNGRKTRFLTQVRSELALTNVTVVQARAEAWTAPAPVATLVSRAVADRDRLVAIAGQHVAEDGQILRMAGPGDPEAPGAECRDGAGRAWRLAARHPVQLPGMTQTHYLDQLRRSA